MPGGLLESGGIVGSQIDDHGVRLSRGKIIRSESAEAFVFRTAAETAELFVAGGNFAVRVVVPAGQYAPAALGDDIGVRAEGICGHFRVIAAVAHVHRNPVEIPFRPIGALPGGNAVTHKFQGIFSFGNRIKAAVCLKAADDEAAVLVFNHGLCFSRDTHIFNGFFTHAAEQTQRLDSRHKHLPAYKFPVDFYGHPHFKSVPADFQINPKFRA